MKILYLVFVIFLGNYPMSVFPAAVYQESQIPDPDNQHELPNELIGDFIIPAVYMNITFSVFPSNKYLILLKSDDHAGSEYGHIIKSGDTYFFSPLESGSIIKTQTAIHLTSNGFYFFSPNGQKENVLRKRQMMIGSAAAKFSIPRREEKSRYYKRRDDVSLDHQSKFIPDIPRLSLIYSLYIANGEVRIALRFHDGSVFWDGYLEITEETEEETRGKIIFTEGAAYNDMENGIASITMRGSDIMVIIPCIKCYPGSEDNNCDTLLDQVIIF
jgi:hypothetical protein